MINKTNAMFFFAVLIFLNQVTYAAGINDGAHLFKNKKTEYTIVVSPNALEAARKAALELQRLLYKSSGKKFLIIKNGKKIGGKALYIGYSDWMSDIVSVQNIKKDGYVIFEYKDDVYFIGNDNSEQVFFRLNTKQSASAGTYNAVVDFARQYLGAQWFMPGPMGEEINQINELIVPKGEIAKSEPKFAIRYIDIMNTVSKKPIAALAKSQSIEHVYYDKTVAQLGVEWGRHMKLGSNQHLPVSHAWHKWIPAEIATSESLSVYGKSSPGFFAKNKSRSGGYYYGNDKQHGGQLCICNPELVNVLAKNIIRYAQVSGNKNFSLSPNDGNWECDCACCKANPQNFKTGTQELTDEVVSFSNDIASRVLEEIPDAHFGLYAYNWMSNPPRNTKVKDEIRISTVYNGLGYQAYLNDRIINVETNLSSWREKSGHTTLTTYFSFYGHYSMPWAGITGHQWLADFLLDDATSDGLRMNYAIHNIAPVGLLGAGPWVLSNLLWGSDHSYEELEDEYYTGAFGVEAGGIIKEYFYLIDQAVNNSVNKVPFKGSGSVKSYITNAYKPIKKECQEKIDAATQVVKKMPLRYQWRVKKIAKGWEFAELTLELIEAKQNHKLALAKKLTKRRQKIILNAYSNDPFSIAPVAADYFESIVPLVH